MFFFTVSFGSFEPCNGDDDANDMDDADADDDDDNDDELIRFQSDCPSPLGLWRTCTAQWGTNSSEDERETVS